MSTKVLIGVALAGPVMLAAITAGMLAAAAVGRHPFWTPERFNMSEAAAARDVATIAAQLGRGEDPNTPYPVRPPLLDSIGGSLTPLEAGVLARRSEVVELLVKGGAQPDERTRARLICEALHNGDRDIAQWLGAAEEGVACPR